LRQRLAANIRFWRKKRGFSQEKLAEMVNVSTQTVNDIECCRSWMSDRTLARLAEALYVEVYQFFMPEQDGPEAAEAFPVTSAVLQLGQDMKTGLNTYISAYIDECLQCFLTTGVQKKE
jgi:transcriptional regulator with XRE-family HTH domain